MKKDDNEQISFDYLNILSKTEIIQFLKEEMFFRAPDKHTVKFFKWRTTYEKIEKEMDKHIQNSKSLFHAKEADRLAVEFNNEKDINNRLKILKKRSKHLEAMQSEEEEWGRINKKREDNFKLLSKSDAVVKK